MSNKSDFAALMETTAPGRDRARRKLQPGEVVEATVLQVGMDWVFVDVGTPGDGRIQSVELSDQDGLRVRVGDVLRATVVDGEPDGPTLTTAFGRGSDVDSSTLALAHESRTPIQGVVAKASKGGLEVEMGRARAFCPASQVELGYASELESYVGKTLDFLVIELPKGRSPVLSRKALLQAERQARETEARANIEPGKEIEGVVTGLQAQGAVVDLGGVDGFVHISELSVHRVERVEDVVQIGEKVTARVLSVEDTAKGLRIRLSLRTTREKIEAPKLDEILEGSVVSALQHGIVVGTPKGEGFVPLRELELAPGEDHRKSFPVGRKLLVVATHHDPKTGRARFSVQAVKQVEEQRNFRDYASGAAAGAEAGSLGSFGKLLQQKLGIATPPKAAGVPKAAAASAVQAASVRSFDAPAPQPAPTRQSAGPQNEPRPKLAKPAPVGPLPAGVVKRPRP